MTDQRIKIDVSNGMNLEAATDHSQRSNTQEATQEIITVDETLYQPSVELAVITVIFKDLEKKDRAIVEKKVVNESAAIGEGLAHETVATTPELNVNNTVAAPGDPSLSVEFEYPESCVDHLTDLIKTYVGIGNENQWNIQTQMPSKV